jgi:hypothetical protein
MESRGLLDMENPVHQICLFLVYKPLIQASLDRTISSWNLHKIRTAHNRSPVAMYELSREKAIQRGYWTGDPGDDVCTASGAEYGLDPNSHPPPTQEQMGEADGPSAEPLGDNEQLRGAGLQLNAEEELEAAEEMLADGGVDYTADEKDGGMGAYCTTVAYMEAYFA